MSGQQYANVRFQETVQQGMGNMGNMPGMQNIGQGIQGMMGGAARGAMDGKNYKHPLAHELGEALTRGGGAQGYLASYLNTLKSYKFRTRMLTSGGSAAAQELIASWIAQDRNRHGHYFTSRVPKMALYGAFVSAPMGHFILKFMQFFFENRTSVFAKVFQIAISNLIISPMQNTIYLITMAFVAGARNLHQVRATIRAGFWPVMTVSWISSPLCLAFAQQFLPEEYWVPFFNFVAFCIGVYVNSHTKKKRLHALRRKRTEEGGRSSETIETETYVRRDY